MRTHMQKREAAREIQGDKRKIEKHGEIKQRPNKKHRRRWSEMRQTEAEAETKRKTA